MIHRTAKKLTRQLFHDRYDFPRSHQGEAGGDGKSGKEANRRHCYSNAAPGEMSTSGAAAEIFTFNNNPVTGSSMVPTISPSVYSNLASPFPLASPSPALLPMTPFSPPPSVNRTLKPKQQGTAGGADGPLPPPSVNRQLKPNRESLSSQVQFNEC